MDHHTPIVLGKRGRRAALLSQTLVESVEAPPPKRSRAYPRECLPLDEACAASKARSGLLTPEPSTLNESQVPLSASAKEDIDGPLDPEQIFAFMSLPAELRLHIYHMALVRPYPLNLHVDKAPEPTDTTTTTPSHDTLHPSQMFPQRVPRAPHTSPPPPPSASTDPVVPEILVLNKQIYKEARQLLYSDNVFRLTLATGIHTLSTLHQRSRSLIKHVVLTIPSHHDILDGFADLVRLGLRYCWGLKSFRIILHASLPDDGRVSGATSVYANAFHILRWLPRGCSVVLEGCVSETVRKVVLEEGRLMNVLDERQTSYLKRQHQMPERH